MAKTYAIADIHGRSDLLLRAVELIAKEIGQTDKVIVLGDYIDRGPNAAGVIHMLRELQRAKNWYVLAGNHEDMMMNALRLKDNHSMQLWLRNGGVQTLMSYGYKNGDPLDPMPENLVSHLEWLRTRPIWVGDKHRIYVHGGVPSDKHIGDVPDGVLQWWLYDHYNAPEHDVPELWNDEPHISGKHIVHGHHQHHMNPARHLKHRTNLDSFAWYTGRLAIGVFDDDVPGGPVKVLDAIGLPHQEQRDMEGSV